MSGYDYDYDGDRVGPGGPAGRDPGFEAGEARGRGRAGTACRGINVTAGAVSKTMSDGIVS